MVVAVIVAVTVRVDAPRASVAHVRRAEAGAAQAAAQAPRLPLLDGASALNVHHNAATIDLLAVCMLERALGGGGSRVWG